MDTVYLFISWPSLSNVCYEQSCKPLFCVTYSAKAFVYNHSSLKYILFTYQFLCMSIEYRCLPMSEKAVRSMQVELKTIVSYPTQEPNSSSLQYQQELLTAEPYLQSLVRLLMFKTPGGTSTFFTFHVVEAKVIDGLMVPTFPKVEIG